MAALPKRQCPVCGKTFSPKSKLAIYDSRACRIRAHRQRKENARKLESMNGKLEQLRQRLPETAKLVEAIVLKHGADCGQMAIHACLEAAKEFNELYAKRVKQPM